MVSKKKKSGNVITLRFDDNSLARDLFGSEDRHLKDLEKRLGVEIDARGTDLRISGPDSDIEVGERILNQLYNLLKKGYPVIGSDIERAFRLLTRDSSANLESLFSESIFLPARKRAIVPRTPGQKAYLEAIRDNDIVFAIGPAGTGKSYLAVAMAVASLVKKDYEKIIFHLNLRIKKIQKNIIGSPSEDFNLP